MLRDGETPSFIRGLFTAVVKPCSKPTPDTRPICIVFEDRDTLTLPSQESCTPLHFTTWELRVHVSSSVGYSCINEGDVIDLYTMHYKKTARIG